MYEVGKVYKLKEEFEGMCCPSEGNKEIVKFPYQILLLEITEGCKGCYDNFANAKLLQICGRKRLKVVGCNNSLCSCGRTKKGKPMLIYEEVKEDV